jgi:hypothetical protein
VAETQLIATSSTERRSPPKRGPIWKLTREEPTKFKQAFGGHVLAKRLGDGGGPLDGDGYRLGAQPGPDHSCVRGEVSRDDFGMEFGGVLTETAQGSTS